MQRVDGQTLSPQSDKPSRRCPQNSTDRKSLHVPLGINSSLKGHRDNGANATVVPAKVFK